MAGTDIPGDHANHDEAAARLRAAARVLLNRVGHWTAARWAARLSDDDRRSRADLMHGVVQHLADLAAGAENRPLIAVPRLDNDLALPDQLRVMVDDLLDADAPAAALNEAADAIRAVDL